jgi:hypothetical protein
MVKEDFRGYERHFRALHCGDATFEEFQVATMPLWRSMAHEIHRRWPPPYWFSKEETVQNLLLAAWQFVWEYDPRRAKRRSMRAYVVWNAYDKAKKAVHVARSANRHGNPDKSPSHIERPLSAYGDDREEGDDGGYAAEHLGFRAGSEAGAMGTKGFHAADQEQRLVDAEERREQGVQAWARAETIAQARAMEALAIAPTVEDAAHLLFGDAEVRVELRLGTEEEALRFVRRAVRVVAKRAAAAA